MADLFMRHSDTSFLALIFLLLMGMTVPIPGWAANATDGAAGTSPEFGLSEKMGEAISRQAGEVKKQIEESTQQLFEREPLGFDWKTLEHLYTSVLTLPALIPQLTRAVVGHSRLLGTIGSLLVLIFLIAVVYSVLGQKRIMAHIETKVAPFKNRVPSSIYPYILPAHRVVVSALFPLVMLALFTLINTLIVYEAEWFQLIGKLILLWTVGTLAINLLRELLTKGNIRSASQHGQSIFRLSRLTILYVILVTALFWTAESFRLRQDVLALLYFAVSLSVVTILFLLTLKKNALLSLLPDLPQHSYKKFVNLIRRYYYPLILFSLLLAILWTLGYRSLGRTLLIKIWSSGAAYLVMMVVYHLLLNGLTLWHNRVTRQREAAQRVYRSLKSLLVYSVSIATVLIVLNLLGLLGLLEQAMSFPVFQLGQSNVSLWILLKAALIILAFVFFSRLSQAYLDYKVYPALGIEQGLGYALNTFLKYAIWAVGMLVALNIVGLDLKFLFVFAGAIGIGIGLGMQNIAANVISGFTMIFGGKLRKGDWIEVGGTMGTVTDIYLRATQVRTRDDIEYLIPNTDFITGTLVNYSLGSPLIRIAVPVGVSYNADPRKVEEILLDAARNEPDVSNAQPAMVRFVEFGDNSINFELLIWIDVRTTPRRRVRSNLYFTIFEELAKAGIEIPFPQRDIHIRSTV